MYFGGNEETKILFSPVGFVSISKRVAEFPVKLDPLSRPKQSIGLQLIAFDVKQAKSRTVRRHIIEWIGFSSSWIPGRANTLTPFLIGLLHQIFISKWRQRVLRSHRVLEIVVIEATYSIKEPNQRHRSLQLPWQSNQLVKCYPITQRRRRIPNRCSRFRILEAQPSHVNVLDHPPILWVFFTLSPYFLFFFSSQFLCRPAVGPRVWTGIALLVPGTKKSVNSVKPIPG